MIPEVIGKVIPTRFKKPTDRELEQIMFGGGVRNVVTVACSITDSFDTLWSERNKAGEMRLVRVASETLLPAVSAGIYVGSAGKERAFMHLQNSGFGYTLDGLTSLYQTFNIPAAVLATTRGIAPEDQSNPHRNMGDITDGLTRLWFEKRDKKSVYGNLDGSKLREAVKRGMNRFAAGKDVIIRIHPHGFNVIVKPPEVEPREYTTEDLRQHLAALDKIRHRLLQVWGQTPISREEAHDMIMGSITENTIVVTGNGYEPRALFSRHHRPLNIYGIGNMGAAKAFAVGIKLANPFLPVVVIEGDQNAQHGHQAVFNLEKYNFTEKNFRAYLLDNSHGSSVGTAESLPLVLDNYRYAEVIRTIPEQAGKFGYPRVEDGIAKQYADEREILDTLGPMPFQIKTAMYVIRQKTARVIADLVEEGKLNEANIPPAFTDYKQFAA